MGAPQAFPEEDSSQPGLTFSGAPFQCEPHYRDWSTIVVLQVFGAEVIPETLYEVEAVELGCNLDFASSFSDPLSIATGKWGDIEVLFASPGGSPQPSFKDIAASVKKFQAAPDAPIKAQAQLGRNVVNPSHSIGFYSIGLVVGAFEGDKFKDRFFGACTCPSTVTCGATACTNEFQCDDGAGSCTDRLCTDICGRCAP